MPAALLLAGGILACVSRVAAETGQNPTFRSGVELVVVDAQVSNRDGDPVSGLGPADFTVTIDNRARRVTSADQVSAGMSEAERAEAAANPGGPRPLIRTPGEIKNGARVYIIVVDASSFSMSSMRPAMLAAQRFVDSVFPADLVGVYEVPYGAYRMDLTHDHAAVKSALGKILGRRDPPTSRFHLSLSEIVDISAGDEAVHVDAADRECPDKKADPRGYEACFPLVSGEAYQLGSYYENVAQQSVFGIGRLLSSLAWIPSRKTVVYVSGGMIAADRIGGRPDVAGMMREAGAQAAGSDTNLYVLHVDDAFLDSFSAQNTGSPDPSARFRTAMRDQSASGNGLDLLAGYANGQLLRVQAGTGDVAFNRILRETSAYYLLGIEPEPTDRDGKIHFIRVKVKAKGANIRNRAQVMIPKATRP